MNKVLSVLWRPSSKNFATLTRRLSYKSDISLDKLYPTSKLNIYTPPPPANRPDGKWNGYIPMDELEVTYSRASGPGGQNVNCVNTKVDLRVNVASATFIPEEAKSRIMEEHKNSINKNGQLVIRSDVTRSQQLNLADALQKLRTIIRAEIPSVFEPSEETLEKIRKRQANAARVRLHFKRERSNTKADRQGL